MIILTALSTKEIIAAVLIVGCGEIIMAAGFSTRIASWVFKCIDKLSEWRHKLENKIFKHNSKTNK